MLRLEYAMNEKAVDLECQEGIQPKPRRPLASKADRIQMVVGTSGGRSREATQIERGSQQSRRQRWRIRRLNRASPRRPRPNGGPSRVKRNDNRAGSHWELDASSPCSRWCRVLFATAGALNSSDELPSSSQGIGASLTRQHNWRDRSEARLCESGAIPFTTTNINATRSDIAWIRIRKPITPIEADETSDTFMLA